MSYQKSNSINRCTFIRRTILPNFILIWYDMMEPYASFQQSPHRALEAEEQQQQDE